MLAEMPNGLGVAFGAGAAVCEVVLADANIGALLNNISPNIRAKNVTPAVLERI